MTDVESNAEAANNTDPQPQTRRKIPGNLPYTNSPGPLGRTLEKIPISEKPAVFTNDFLSTVLGVSGGSARPIIPILKATGLLNPSGSPTDLYSQFQTDGGRATAALQALKGGFAEIFKRNQFAHRAEESAIRDIIVSVTGLPKNEPIVRSIYNTFEVFQKYARNASEDNNGNISELKAAEGNISSLPVQAISHQTVGLVYNINIALPETTNLEVYNTIFKSLKANLLQ